MGIVQLKDSKVRKVHYVFSEDDLERRDVTRDPKRVTCPVCIRRMKIIGRSRLPKYEQDREGN